MAVIPLKNAKTSYLIQAHLLGSITKQRLPFINSISFSIKYKMRKKKNKKIG